MQGKAYCLARIHSNQILAFQRYLYVIKYVLIQHFHLLTQLLFFIYKYIPTFVHQLYYIFISNDFQRDIWTYLLNIIFFYTHIPSAITFILYIHRLLQKTNGMANFLDTPYCGKKTPKSLAL